jgi:hypothetical protein
MKATIFCDDSVFAAKARSLLRRVGDLPGVSVRWTIKAWPVGALHHASVSERALLESADAHLVVLPGKHARSLSADLRDWLNRWATQRQLEDAAVGVIGDEAGSDPTSEVSLELRLLIERHGLNLIHAGAATSNVAAKLSVGFSLEPEQQFPVGLARLPGTGMAVEFRGFGINE